MFFFYVSWCTEAPCKEVVQLLVHGMLACAWSRTRIQLLWTKSHGARLYAHKQTFWTEDEFTVTASSGIRDCDARVAEIVAKELEKTKPDKWG